MYFNTNIYYYFRNFNKFKEKYSIENTDISEVRKIMAIRYAITTVGYSSTKALQIAEGKPLDGNFDEFLSDIEVRDKKVYTSAVPDMDYISGANKRCLDAAIAKYKDTDPYDLSDLSHDSAWEEAMTRIQDDPQKNFITIIDIARAGKATKDMVDYIREKQIVKNALS